MRISRGTLTSCAGQWLQELERLLPRAVGERLIVVTAGRLERASSGVLHNTQLLAISGGRIESYRKTHVPTSEIGCFAPGGSLPVFALRGFRGLAFALDPWGAVIAETESDAEDLLVADLRADDFARRRAVAETFFPDFRRPELYGPVCR